MTTRIPGRRGTIQGTPKKERTPAEADEAARQASALEALWQRFKKDAEPVAREALILHYSPLVKYVAGRVGVGLPQNIEQADLVSYGIFGLIDAIEKFDTTRAIKFETYAISRIRGAIIDELRAIDWIPRSVRFKAREVERALGELEGRLLRPPSDAELAEELGVSLDDLQETLNQINLVSVVALPMCGRSTTFLALARALDFGSGSFSKTSKPAPASHLFERARARSRSLITWPLDVLMRYAVGFIFRRAVALMICLLDELRLACTLTKSLRERRSSRSTYLTPSWSSFAGSLRLVLYTTVMPNPFARLATAEPILPNPIIPKVALCTSEPSRRSGFHPTFHL